MVEFYSPGCPHCVRLKEVWRAVAKNLAGHVLVGAVNCERESVCSRFHVRGVPAIKFFPTGATAPLEYQEARTVEGIVAFIKRQAPSAVKKVAATARSGVVALDDFLQEQPALGRVVLFKRGSLSPTLPYKTLSTRFREKIIMGIADAKNADSMAKQLGVVLPADGDALVIIPVGETKGKIHEGKLTFTDLSAFFNKFAQESASTSAWRRPKTDL